MGKRGGKRENAGRKKLERPTNANVAQRVLAEAEAEKTWLQLIDLEKERLGLDAKPISKDDIGGPYSVWRGNVSIIPLTNVLRYLEDRAFGKPVDTINHLHDKPVELHATLTLGEGMRIAMEKADQRVHGKH
jgi:hypothetical protein